MFPEPKFWEPSGFVMTPSIIPNWINGDEVFSADGQSFDKRCPNDGKILCQVTRSRESEVKAAVDAALAAQPAWAETPAVKRGERLHEIVLRMKTRQDEIARIVAIETGRSKRQCVRSHECHIHLAVTVIASVQIETGYIICMAIMTIERFLRSRKLVAV